MVDHISVGVKLSNRGANVLIKIIRASWHGLAHIHEPLHTPSITTATTTAATAHTEPLIVGVGERNAVLLVQRFPGSFGTVPWLSHDIR